MIVHVHDYPNLLNNTSDLILTKKKIKRKHTRKNKSHYFWSVYGAVCPFTKEKQSFFAHYHQ